MMKRQRTPRRWWNQPGFTLTVSPVWDKLQGRRFIASYVVDVMAPHPPQPKGCRVGLVAYVFPTISGHTPREAKALAEKIAANPALLNRLAGDVGVVDCRRTFGQHIPPLRLLKPDPRAEAAGLDVAEWMPMDGKRRRSVFIAFKKRTGRALACGWTSNTVSRPAAYRQAVSHALFRRRRTNRNVKGV